jgi:hypothetical protein
MTTEIEIKWSLRQNMWKVFTGIFNTIQTIKVITCPGYHSRESCPNEFPTETELNENKNNKTGNRYIHLLTFQMWIFWDKNNIIILYNDNY